MSETIRIGKYDVDKDPVWLYIQHFGRDKSDIFEWDKERIMIHNFVFKEVGVDRHSDEGQEFSKAFDSFCEQHIEKYDKIVVAAKRLASAKSKEEIKHATLRLELEMYRQERMLASGFRGFSADDENFCRICNKELLDGIPRANDHLSTVPGFEEINKPICLTCSDECPDEYHVAFKKRYWNK